MPKFAGLFLSVLLSLFATSALASIRTYEWHQTGGTDGFFPHASYSYDTALGMPTVDSDADVIDLRGLLSLSVVTDFIQITIANLVPPCDQPDCGVVGMPIWRFSPVFFYNDVSSDISVGSDTISANTDHPGVCMFTGVCIAEGYWTWSDSEPTPEPATLALFAVAPLVLGKMYRRGRRRHSTR